MGFRPGARERADGDLRPPAHTGKHQQAKDQRQPDPRKTSHEMLPLWLYLGPRHSYVDVPRDPGSGRLRVCYRAYLWVMRFPSLPMRGFVVGMNLGIKTVPAHPSPIASASASRTSDLDPPTQISRAPDGIGNERGRF